MDTFETGAGPVHEMKRASLKRRVTVDVEGFPIMIAVHEASLQDRNGAPDVIFGIAEKAPQVTKLWADGGYAGPSWGTRWPDTASVPEIVPGPKEARKQGASPSSTTAGWWNGHLPGCTGARVWRSTWSGPGRFHRLGSSWPLPVLDARGGARDNAMKYNNMTKSMSYDLTSQ